MRNFEFLRISTEDGLSHSTVYGMAEDRIGNLWIATADGLNKFDGYRFTLYRHSDLDSNTLSSDYLRGLVYVKDDKLLSAGKRGVTLFDIRNGRFRNYRLDEEIENIQSTDDGQFFLNSLETIYQFDPKTEQLHKICSAPAGVTFSFVKSYRKQLLVGSSHGFFVLVEKKLADSQIPIKANIQDIMPTEKGLWIATEGQGLYWYPQNGIQKHYIPQSNGQGIISSYVRRLQMDNDGQLWIGTLHGLSVYDTERATFTNFDSESPGRKKLTHNSIRCIYRDRQGGMWLGTYFGGINYYHAKQQTFGLIHHVPRTNSLNDNIISAIVEGQDNDLWIGTNDKGLNRLDRSSGQFSYYSKSDGLRSNMIKAILVEGGQVYIGTHGGGLAKLNAATGKITNYPVVSQLYGSGNVYGILKANQDSLWVATLEGLRLFNKQKEVFVPLPAIDLIAKSEQQHWKDIATHPVYALYNDSRGRVWIGTDQGIYAYDVVRKKVMRFHIANRDKYDRINCFLEDQKGQIWVGMHSGLGRVNEVNRRVNVFNADDGLPNNTVYGILQDKQGQLWISTNKGIACLTTQPRILRRYTYRDGLQGNQFNYYASLFTHDNEIYFGGVNGITHFYPEKLRNNPFIPSPFISELRVYGKIIRPYDDTGILKEDISYVRQISLGADQNSFTLFLTVPNFLSRQNNAIAYKLLGEDTDWIYADFSLPVSYSNLEAGTYTFMVRAANSDGKWSDETAILTLEVKPHWWNTWVFRAAFFFLLLSVAYYWLRIWRNKQMLKNELALEKLEKEKNEEINQAKLRFFTNISHEFRTPLTLITSPLQELQNKIVDKNIKKQLAQVSRNANKLTHLIDQLMDYRRADLGVFALKVIYDDPIPQLRQLLDMFERIAQQKNISLSLDVHMFDSKIWFDPMYFDLIFSNLLSNAFKFTQEGQVVVIVDEVEGQAVLEVRDTGVGMKPETVDRVFEQFFQESNEVKGTGIGLALVKRLVELHHAKIEVDSVFGKGSIFRLYFSLDSNVYAEQEKGGDIAGEVSYLRAPVEEWQRFEEEEMEAIFVDSDIPTKRPILLIAEDNIEVRELLVSHFRQFTEVYAAANGEEALMLLDDKAVDLIITDVMMPLLDGVSLCKRVKQQVATSHIPVIMLTARANDLDEIGGLSAGADVYVRKPFDLRKLSLQVRNLLQVRYRIKQFYSQNLDIEPQKLAFNELDRVFLEKAKAIVERNLDNITFSVDDFCSEIAMSRSTLHLKMKAITGASTIEFIRKIRFNEASRLIKEGKYSISEISVMVGFNTPSYFTTSFKAYFGMSPSEYNKQQ